MASQSVFIQVWKPGDGKKEQWQTNGLVAGSPIEVAVSGEEIYWVWEKVLESNEVFWRFRPSVQQQLYITNDDDNGVTMQPTGPQSYFKVYVAYHGYIIRVPKTQKYLAVKNGRLVLSAVPAVWFLKLQHATESDPIVNMTEDADPGVMWICDDPVAGSAIVVEHCSTTEDKAKWLIHHVLQEEAYYIQPIANEKLYVTCDVVTDSVTVEREDTASENSRLLKDDQLTTGDPNTCFILDDSATRYFNTKLEGETSILALTADGRRGVVWRPSLNSFVGNGRNFPSDPRSGCDEQANIKE